MRLLTILSVTVAAAALSGCAVTKTALDTKSEVTVKRSLQDVTAARAIKARMVRASEHDLEDISVDVVQGIVVLAGATPSAASKKEAERIAWSAPGVAKVGNEIYVGRKTGFAQKTKDELIDTAVRTKLASSNEVRNLNYRVETRDGVVYLLGVARSQNELKEAARLASITRGVKEVVSYVTVKGDIKNAYGSGYAGGSQSAPTIAYSGGEIPSTRYNGTPYGEAPAPSVSADDDLSFWGTPVEGAQDIYGGDQAALPPASMPIDPSAPLPYNPNHTELDADALDSGEPYLRDPYTGEKIELPEGVKPLPYIPPGPGSLGEGAMPLPPGAEDKIAKFGAGTALPPALPQPQPQPSAPLASPSDPGPVNALNMPPGESVRITKPYTIDPNTGEKIEVSWNGSQWVGVIK